MEKGKCFPTFKIGDKPCIKNYRPVCILPVCGKVFELLLYNNMFSFFSENDLISPKQSGFRPGDSCTNQLLSIAHEILSAFDGGHEVRSVFLDISKALDINTCFSSYTKMGYQKQRVVLNGQHSSWADIKAGNLKGQFLVLYYF